MMRWIGTAGTSTHSRTQRWRTSDMMWSQSMRQPGPYPVGTPGIRTLCPQLRHTQTLHHHLSPLQSIPSQDASLHSSRARRHSPPSSLTSVTTRTLRHLRQTLHHSSPSQIVLHTSCAPPECVVCEAMPSLLSRYVPSNVALIKCLTVALTSALPAK
jgi:hypothetical protein